MRHAPEHRPRTVSGRRNDDEIAQPFEQVFDETTGVLPGLHNPIDGRERGRSIHRRDGVNDLIEQRAVGVAEESDGSLVLDARHTLRRLGTRDELVEQ